MKISGIAKVALKYHFQVTEFIFSAEIFIVTTLKMISPIPTENAYEGNPFLFNLIIILIFLYANRTNSGFSMSNIKDDNERPCYNNCWTNLRGN